MLKNPIGAHYSIKNGYLGAFKAALEDGADSLQIFAKSPASAKLRSITKEESQEVSKWKDRKKIRGMVIHGSYLINLADKVLSPGAYQIKSLAEDMRNAEALGGIGALVHMGKFLKNDREDAINNFVTNIKTLLNETKDVKAKIIIENTAGQGTEMGHDLKELALIYKKIGDKKRVKICVDTAHAFGAGYDIAKKPKDVASEIDKLIGLKNIACIHLNDSKKPLNSRVDRHGDIGFGEIGVKGLKTFTKEIERLGGEDIPLILEVPKENSDYKEQIKLIRNS